MVNLGYTTSQYEKVALAVVAKKDFKWVFAWGLGEDVLPSGTII